ncbi:3-methyladenine DNA glycosylase [Nocardioides sp. YIM 152588]|uniref:3-methyladenine DNA glycosylase n=1 Tax=Nocardioides sp. YIM 152588 TaxID=3158259 RepID=UPI0032E4C46F
MEVLERAQWRERAASHAERIDRYTAPHLARREARTKHPVFDFLFTYYSYRPAQLRRWHPGYGVALAGAEEHAGLKGYEVLSASGFEARFARTSTTDGPVVEVRGAPAPSLETTAAVSEAHLASQQVLLTTLHRLLRATAARPAHLGCFGLHEWAMVYRQTQDELRHNAWPLRLGSAGTDEVVEGHRIACSHFDAYRFFTAPARPLNALSPGRDDRDAFEQPGCLHAGMDLYKHAFRLSPLVSSDLVADCFELAWEIRVMDMRAAPYDIAALGFDPIRIETPEGKREYVDAQRAFTERAAPLRARLIAECERLLAVPVAA